MPTRCASCPHPGDALCVDRDAIVGAVACEGIDCSKACETILKQLRPHICEGDLYPQEEARRALLSAAEQQLWEVDGKYLTFTNAVLRREYKESLQRVTATIPSAAQMCKLILKSALDEDSDDRLSLHLPIFQAVAYHTIGCTEEKIRQNEEAIGGAQGNDGQILANMDAKRDCERILEFMHAAYIAEKAVIGQLRTYLEQSHRIFSTDRQRDLARADLAMLEAAFPYEPDWFRYTTLHHLNPAKTLPVCIRLSSRPDRQPVKPNDLTNYFNQMSVRLKSLLQSFLVNCAPADRNAFIETCLNALQNRQSAAVKLINLQRSDKYFLNDSGFIEIHKSSRRKRSTDFVQEFEFIEDIVKLFYLYSVSDFDKIIKL
jgi:hypothetical protein